MMDKKALVLIVEDNPGNRELTKQQLDLLGCETAVVSGGAEAIAAVERGAPSLILMDCNMPGMNGPEASRAIRALPDGVSVPIVAVTADTNEDTKRSFLEAGANDVIHRPVLLDDLRAVVERWIDSAADGSPGGTGPAPGVLSRLRDEVGEETTQRVVALYLGSLDERIAAISAAVGSGDPETLKNAVHALKSATSVFDAADVSDACAELEARPFEGASAHLGVLLSATAELRAFLEAARASAGYPQPDSTIL